MKIIKIDFNNSRFDAEPVYLPYQENMDDKGYDTFEELKEKWESKKWDYYHHPTVTLIDTDLHPYGIGTLDIFEGMPKTIPDTLPEGVNIKDESDTSRCDEFDVWFFNELGYTPDFYSRPFDNSPANLKFCGWFAADCYKGDVYSKDFAYHTCDTCQRTICYQNPSNGWHVQFKTHDGWMECNKCAEERLLENGVDVEELISNGSLGDGLFMNANDLENNGWSVVDGFDSALVGSGRFGGNGSVNPIHEKMRDLANEGKKVFIEYDSMAIGGLGGYITLWQK